MPSPFLDVDGLPVPEDQILGNGGTALVIIRNELAVKMPLRYRWTSESDFNSHLSVIRKEQEVYRRLQHSGRSCCHIVHCVNIYSNRTELAWMKHGDLRSFLTKNQPSRSQKLSWYLAMASGLAYIHSQRVLVADIASRNFLVDSDLSIKFCDFTESTLFPMDTDMGSVDDLGYTVELDIRLLAAVFYEVETGEKCEVVLYKEDDPLDDRACWPKRQFLPSTESLRIGPIIESCWKGEIRSADALVRALTLLYHKTPKSRLEDQPVGFLSRLCTFSNSGPTMVFGLLATAAVLVWSKRGR
ncbi:uncharacterized protein N7484_007034 [Penicillium longicatenatum]|uniref:uncharacterized protein n=1 Tax=Penicillium longicatenatum TaxID=1561947 RepID=UPI002546744F|nr:uncharacterized protein N7484_007034 [Penicillium longicatenatum]KAJ5639172.1 hypothetical protein N7484_007034 [Penicillium longicatenatum]